VPRAVRIIAVLLLSLSLGLHWVVLQSVAWTAMVIGRTQTNSFTVALKTTFDGKHPCRICNVVAAGKNAEKKTEATGKTVKLELLAGGSVTPSLHPPLPVTNPDPLVPALSSRVDAPALPPPRA
jgi:hypothetical protein